MKSKLWLLSVILIVMVMATGTGPAIAQEKSYSADRFDVDITLAEDGSLLVTETIAYRFVGGPFTFVFRELPTDHTDGITILQASVDGRAYDAGENAGQVEIGGNDPIRITWHLEPTLNETRTFVLTYQVAGVVRQEAGLDVLYWQALPDEYDYAIASSVTTVRYPAQLTLSEGPAVQIGRTTITQESGLVSFASRDLTPNSPLVIGLRFPGSSLISAAPAWQNRQQSQSAQTPYWIGAALALFGAGLAGVVIWVSGYRIPSQGTESQIIDPPTSLSPGVAGTLLTSDIRPTWSNALGTLFDLAEKGVLEIDESPEKKWYRRHDFIIRLLERPVDLRPHQVALLDLLFTTKKGPVKTIKFSDLQNVVSSRRWKQFGETMHAEIKSAHYLSSSRKRARRNMTIAGFLLLLVGGIALVVAGIFSARTGFAPMAIGGSFLLTGIAVLIGGAMIPPLTDEALEIAASWKAYSAYLRRVSRGKEVVTNPNMFIKYLPFAATFGLLPQWARHFEKKGWTKLPPYFKALPTSDPGQSMAAFVAMSSASTSSAGAAAGAGAAGAGAAGGGAAGAG